MAKAFYTAAVLADFEDILPKYAKGAHICPASIDVFSYAALSFKALADKV